MRIAAMLLASLLVLGCASQPPPPAPQPPAPQPTAPPTHFVPIDEPLPAPEGDQVVLELRVIRSEAPSGESVMPSTLPSDGMLLTRLRTLATIGKPFACDACVQETSVRITGTVTELDGRRYRVSINLMERFGLRARQFTSRIELPAGEEHVLGGLTSAGGQDLLVVTLRRGQK